MFDSELTCFLNYPPQCASPDKCNTGTNDSFVPRLTVGRTPVHEFVVDLKRAAFQMRTSNRDLIKTYKMGRRTILTSSERGTGSRSF
jgi:hypothetical protein